MILIRDMSNIMRPPSAQLTLAAIYPRSSHDPERSCRSNAPSPSWLSSPYPWLTSRHKGCHAAERRVLRLSIDEVIEIHAPELEAELYAEVQAAIQAEVATTITT